MPTPRYTFGHGKGRAIRDTNDEFLNVWEHFDSSNPLDRKAAHEAARRDSEIKANMESRKPGCIGVLQDERGNAMSSYSVKGPAQGSWKSKMSKTQKSVLNKIPESQRGAGTGSAQNRCWPKTRITSQSSPLIPSLKDTAMQLLTGVPTGKGSVMIRRNPLAKLVRKPTNLRVFSMAPRKSFESDNIYSHGTNDSQSNVNLCTHWVEVSSEGSFFTIALVK